MDKQTLSHYGWIVVMILTLSVILAFATPLGKYVGRGVSNIAIAIGFVNDDAVDDDKLKEKEDQWEDFLGLDETDPAPPMPLTKGQIYRYGEYEYCYGYRTCIMCEDWAIKCGCPGISNSWTGVTMSNEIEGWSARVIDPNKTSYGPMLETLGGKPIVDTTYTYYNCIYLTDISRIIIPKTVTTMYGTFGTCISLTSAIDLEIPNSVTNITAIFCDCESLVSPPTIPNSVTRMSAAFQYCTSLICEANTPSGVIDDKFWIYYGCRQLGYSE